MGNTPFDGRKISMLIELDTEDCKPITELINESIANYYANKNDSIVNIFVRATKQLLVSGYTIDEIHSIVDESLV